MKLQRIILIGRGSLAWIGLLMMSLWADLRADQPNFLLILIDDLGREAVGTYGGESHATPNMDRLAAEGLQLEQFFVMPVCHPTRVSLLTGRYLHSIGNPKWGHFPKGTLERQTLANRLRAAGYATAISGKWQLTPLAEDPQHPHRLGFDHYSVFGWHEGPRYFDPLIWENGRRRGDLKGSYGPDLFSEFLMDFITDSRDQPFFAFYSMNLCHAVSDDLDPHPPHGPKGRYLSFREMLEEADRRIGEFVDHLDRLGLREKTLVMVTTDNGTAPSNFIRHEGRRLIDEPPIVSQWKGRAVRGGKGSFSDWGIRVPALLSWPGTISPQRRSDAILDCTDLLPTFLELAGVAPGIEGLEGTSFAGLLRGQPFRRRAWVSAQTKSQICVRNLEWKLHDDGRLYHMAEDPLETHVILPSEDSLDSALARLQLSRVINRWALQP